MKAAKPRYLRDSVKKTLALLVSVLCVLGLVFSLLLFVEVAVFAQATEPLLTLGLRRDFGYGGFGEIQGLFRLWVSGPEDLERVAFFLDEMQIGEATEPPWQLQFHTDSYPPGSHTLFAIGRTKAGRELRSNEIRARFLSADEAGGATARIIVILLGGILGLMAFSFVVTMALSRRKPHGTIAGMPRSYGIAGGAICPSCGRPFARHLWAPNLLMGKLERCPYCGKWAVVRAATKAELAAAEASEPESGPASSQITPSTVEDRLRRDLEDSRFSDA